MARLLLCRSVDWGYHLRSLASDYDSPRMTAGPANLQLCDGAGTFVSI